MATRKNASTRTRKPTPASAPAAKPTPTPQAEATITFRRNGESRAGDARLTLDTDAGGVGLFGKRETLYVPVITPDGRELRLQVKPNMYTPDADVESVTFLIRAEAVGSAPVSPVDAAVAAFMALGMSLEAATAAVASIADAKGGK